MTFKFFTLFAAVAFAVVTGLPHGYDDHGHHEIHEAGSSYQNVHLVSHHGHEGDDHHGDDHHDDHAEYKFDYGVEDKKTGDVKSQSESRKGHKVEGKYELIDADGHKRIVHYVADKHLGFYATVHREPLHHHEYKTPEYIFHGGDAKVSEHEHSSYEHGHGHGDEHGHGVHTSEHSYSIKQEHATPIKVHSHHEQHDEWKN